MKICVLIKQVASEDSPLIINSDKSGIESDGVNLITNEPDTYALEEALLLKEQSNGEVVICSFGPESCNQVIKDALAKGADRAIHIVSDNHDKLSPLNIAKTICEKIKSENFDLILSGLQSNDFGFSQTGIIISELLNCSHASLVMGTEILSDSTIKVKRELENGWFQWSELNLPASLSIQSGINEPRYSTLKGIMSVKNKPVDSCNSSDIISNLDNGYSLKEVSIPVKTKETIKIEGSTDEIVEEMINVLKNNIKVI